MELSSSALSVSQSQGLAPYVPSEDMPWNYRRAAHLLRRTRMGAARDKVLELLDMTPQEAIDLLINETLAEPAVEDVDDPEVGYALAIWGELLQKRGLKEKMTLFWSGLLVAGSDDYPSTHIYGYVNLLRTHALGNYKTLIEELGLNPAMLRYLNMHRSEKGEPNENYARELLELFTMGILNKNGEENYSQQDIDEISRAFTGYVDNLGKVNFNNEAYDDGNKTIFGQTGPWDYDDVMRIIFEQRTVEIAEYICGKIYEFFVYSEPASDVVQEMASLFLASNFEVLPVLRALFNSSHFYEERFIGAKIKSPCEAVLGFMTEAGRGFTSSGGEDLREQRKEIQRKLSTLGQKVGSPPDVSGWNEHRGWITTSSLVLRWDVIGSMLYKFFSFDDYDPIPMVQQFEAPNDPYRLVEDIVAQVLGVPLSDGLSLEDRTEILLDGIPYYEWSIETNGAAERIKNFLSYLIVQPEFHLT